jgi:PRTRC genetic system protein E
MGFFTALSPLLKRGSLTIRVSDAPDGKVKLLITQQPAKEGEETVPLPPLRHLDTPEQLDQTLESELAELAAYREGPVQSMLDQAKAQLDEAAAEEKRRSAERLASARKKPATTKPAAPATKPDETKDGVEPEAPDPNQTDLFA